MLRSNYPADQIGHLHHVKFLIRLNRAHLPPAPIAKRCLVVAEPRHVHPDDKRRRPIGNFHSCFQRAVNLLAPDKVIVRRQPRLSLPDV